MGILRRTSDIISANVNDLVDRLEQPDKMLRQALRDLEATTATVKAATARSIASERLLAIDRANRAEEHVTWGQRAQAAIERGEDALARRAIARQFDLAKQLPELDHRLEEAERTTAALRDQLVKLRGTRNDVRERLARWSASQALVLARREASVATGFLGQSGGVLARIERLTDALTVDEVEGAAWLELDAAADGALAQQIEGSTADAAIDAELERLKRAAGRAGNAG